MMAARQFFVTLPSSKTSMIRSRACHLANAYRVPHRPALILLTRRLQTQPGKSTPPKTPVPPPTTTAKPHVKLNPGPIKSPRSIPTTPTPAVAASRPPPPIVQTVDRVSLKNLKETTAKDIAEAEAHGILAPPPEGAGWAKSTLHKAIQIAKFYYRGVKLVYARGKMVRGIKKRVAAGGAPLERWEHRMMRTQDGDEKKLIPFVFIAIILEEVIPLIAIWYPEMLPSTCILPSQRDRIQQGLTDAALAVPTTWGATLGSLTRAANSDEIPLNALNDRNLIRALGCLMHMPGAAFYRPAAYDAFLAKEDLRALSAQDLLQALRERGM
ncbi:Letm1 RBD domain-containing protein [Mycena venus]|uniref:Letm1 RBD domain-containing protein n=1 Tax=Mycena venus TaxID=2733690 RepID=A0A8H7D4L8_9AGAR|nr:Letm1 RBD domain-containing protein [Mycena venus]